MRGNLSSSTVVTRTTSLIESEIDQEIVALSIETGVCYGLNQVGSKVWRLLAAPISISDICTTLIGEYDVEPDVCEAEVIDLIGRLLEEGLVTADQK